MVNFNDYFLCQEDPQVGTSDTAKSTNNPGEIIKEKRPSQLAYFLSNSEVKRK